MCDGYHVEGTFTFFDETERAERLSREARGETHEEGILEVNGAALQIRFSWLNAQALASIPPRLTLDATTLAVDRLFAHWIIYPNDVSPGYMHHLPLLYEKALPNSVLQSSVRALAFADIRRTSSGGPGYRTKALQSYGAAITRLRTVAQDATDLEGDETLAALLLIDAFETLYMGRNEPLGLHAQALEYMLENGGDEQLYSARRFCLSRIAIYRLQARQLLLGEDGGALQQTLLASLNLDRPDLRVIYDVSQIQHLCAKANHLVRHSEQQGVNGAIDDVEALLAEIAELTSSMEAWSSTIDNPMKPMAEVTHLTRPVCQDREIDEAHPLNCFKCSSMLRHHDTSVAFLWTFYAAAQMILHDSTIQLLRLATSLLPEKSLQYQDQIQWEKLAIEVLSSIIIRSFPKFMGFDLPSRIGEHGLDTPSQASSLGRFLGVFSAVVVKRTDATSQAHKDHAAKILAWIRKSSLSE